MLDDFSKELNNGFYVYTLNIINNVGLLNNVFDFLTVDNTVPIPQSIGVLIDQTTANFLGSGELNSTYSYNNISSDTKCKTIATQLRVRWEDFIDFEVPIDHYEIGIGDSSGEDNVFNFYKVGLVNEFLIQSLQLLNYPYVWVTIRGVGYRLYRRRIRCLAFEKSSSTTVFCPRKASLSTYSDVPSLLPTRYVSLRDYYQIHKG